MQRVFRKLMTPYKYGMVVVPEDNSKKLIAHLYIKRTDPGG